MVYIGVEMMYIGLEMIYLGLEMSPAVGYIM